MEAQNRVAAIPAAVGYDHVGLAEASTETGAREERVEWAVRDILNFVEMSITALALQPPAFAERSKIDTGWGIPSPCSIAGAKFQGVILVAIRNPQWGIGSRILPSGR